MSLYTPFIIRYYGHNFLTLTAYSVLLTAYTYAKERKMRPRDRFIAALERRPLTGRGSFLYPPAP